MYFKNKIYKLTWETLSVTRTAEDQSQNEETFYRDPKTHVADHKYDQSIDQWPMQLWDQDQLFVPASRSSPKLRSVGDSALLVKFDTLTVAPRPQPLHSQKLDGEGANAGHQISLTMFTVQICC